MREGHFSMARRDAILRDFHEDKTESEPGSVEKKKLTNKKKYVSSLKSAPSTEKESQCAKWNTVSKKKKQRFS
jgi:hypothetical protein